MSQIAVVLNSDHEVVAEAVAPSFRTGRLAWRWLMDFKNEIQEQYPREDISDVFFVSE